MKILSPSQAANRAWRKRTTAVMPKKFYENCSSLDAAAIFGATISAEELAEMAEACAVNARAKELLERRRIRWLWTSEIPTALTRRRLESRPVGEPGVTQDGVVEYRSYPWSRIINCFRTSVELGKLWRLDRRLLGRRARRSVERTLGESVIGRRILEAAASYDPSEYYGRTPDGTPVFLGLDNVWYTPAEAAAMMADARPWTRAEIIQQWRRHAEVVPIAKEFLAAVNAASGGDAVLGVWGAPSAVSEAELKAATAAVPLLAEFVRAKLGVKTSSKDRPGVRPLTIHERLSGPHGVMVGAHDEARPDEIAIGPGWDRATLVHELVHWACTKYGLRQKLSLSWEAEEALANRIMADYRRAMRK